MLSSVNKERWERPQKKNGTNEVPELQKVRYSSASVSWSDQNISGGVIGTLAFVRKGRSVKFILVFLPRFCRLTCTKTCVHHPQRGKWGYRFKTRRHSLAMSGVGFLIRRCNGTRDNGLRSHGFAFPISWVGLVLPSSRCDNRGRRDFRYVNDRPYGPEGSKQFMRDNHGGRDC